MHPQQKSKFLSCFCDTIQQKQVTLVSINYQRGSCWILALYFPWRGCAACWQLCALFFSAPLCWRSMIDFRLLSLKTFFLEFWLLLFFFPFMVQLCCYPSNCYFISIFLFCHTLTWHDQTVYLSSHILGKMYWSEERRLRKKDRERHVVNNHQRGPMPVCTCVTPSFALFLSILIQTLGGGMEI